MVKILALEEVAYLRIRNSINNFLWVCLSESQPGRAFQLTTDMVQAYPDEVSTLPNVTPNGLVLPKAENVLAYNQVQQEVARAFAATNLYPRINRIQFPINLRLQSGTPNPSVDNRPRASAKRHSDIWAGDPASGVLVFLAVLGSAECASIKFFEPNTFPKSFVRPLEDYLLGATVSADSRELLFKFSEGAWYLVDPFVIHQTIKNKKGYRLSVDFRFVPNDLIPSDTEEDDSRKPYFLPTHEWVRLGKDELILTDDTFAYRGEQTASYTKGYPVRLRVVDTSALRDVKYG